MVFCGGLCRTVICLLTAFILFKPGESIRCSVCESGSGNGASSSCLLRPPSPQPCEERLGYCIEVAKYTKSGVLDSFTRSCSPFSLPGSCIKGKDKLTGETAHICYTTCASDGCNSSSSLHHVLDLLRRKRKWKSHQTLHQWVGDPLWFCINGLETLCGSASMGWRPFVVLQCISYALRICCCDFCCNIHVHT